MTTTPPDARNALAEIVTANCCKCGRIIDTREVKDGGDLFGAQLSDKRWTCSFACWEAIVDPQSASTDKARIAALEAQVEGMRVALENLVTVIKDNKRGVLHSLSRRETDILTQALHDARAALQSSETTGEQP